MASPQPALPAPAPTGTLSVHRRLRGGGSYTLDAAALGVTTLAARDADDDLAVLGFDRAEVRQLIADLTLVAGLTPTGPTVTRAQALTGSARRLFEALAELDKTEPAVVDAILATIVAQLRSWRPVALLAGGAL